MRLCAMRCTPFAAICAASARGQRCMGSGHILAQTQCIFGKGMCRPIAHHMMKVFAVRFAGAFAYGQIASMVPTPVKIGAIMRFCEARLRSCRGARAELLGTARLDISASSLARFSASHACRLRDRPGQSAILSCQFFPPASAEETGCLRCAWAYIRRPFFRARKP
jgi:hypothetical protein